MADNMSFWRQEVIQFALNQDLEAAIAEQKAVLERDPNNARAHFALGTFAHFKGKIDAAVTHFLRSIELDSSLAAPHVSLGRIYAVQGDYDSAWKQAREAERLGDWSLVEQLGRYPNLK
jgi:tetratricopeptide (TPR) repeat protein